MDHPTKSRTLGILPTPRPAPDRQDLTALEQTWAYADVSGAGEAHLVIFDRTPGKPWAEKIWQRVEVYRGFVITVWGC